MLDRLVRAVDATRFDVYGAQLAHGSVVQKFVGIVDFTGQYFIAYPLELGPAGLPMLSEDPVQVAFNTLEDAASIL